MSDLVARVESMFNRPLDDRSQSFGLSVGEVGGCEAPDRLVCIEGPDHECCQPTSSLGMKKTSQPGRIGWK
jgi:hypothetical protein